MIIRIRSIASPEGSGRQARRTDESPVVPSFGKLYTALIPHSAPSVRCAVWHAVQSFGFPKERDAQIDPCVDRVGGSEFR
jgi:hypothetical protein